MPSYNPVCSCTLWPPITLSSLFHCLPGFIFSCRVTISCWIVFSSRHPPDHFIVCVCARAVWTFVILFCTFQSTVFIWSRGAIYFCTEQSRHQVSLPVFRVISWYCVFICRVLTWSYFDVQSPVGDHLILVFCVSVQGDHIITLRCAFSSAGWSPDHSVLCFSAVWPHHPITKCILFCRMITWSQCSVFLCRVLTWTHFGVHSLL
jgi:hypothetical protein